MSVADVLIDTRLAADKLSPTRMDRPEDVEPNPVNGKVYAALTNNSNRGTSYPVDEAEPARLVAHPAGPGCAADVAVRQPQRLRPRDHADRRPRARRSFTWDLMLVCGAPEAQETYFAGFDKSQVSPISCPDNVTFDEEGNLWLATDGNVLGSNDGVFRVPVAGPSADGSSSS